MTVVGFYSRCTGLMVIVLLLLQFSSLRRILTLSFSRPSRVGFVIVTNVWLMVVFSVFTPVKQHSSSLMAQAFPGDEPCGLSLLSVVFLEVKMHISHGPERFTQYRHGDGCNHRYVSSVSDTAEDRAR